jgi:hypothetical protein
MQAQEKDSYIEVDVVPWKLDTMIVTGLLSNLKVGQTIALCSASMKYRTYEDSH